MISVAVVHQSYTKKRQAVASVSDDEGEEESEDKEDEHDDDDDIQVYYVLFLSPIITSNCYSGIAYSYIFILSFHSYILLSCSHHPQTKSPHYAGIACQPP